MALSTYIDQQSERLLATLRRLVAVRTVNPPGENYDTITALLTAELDAAGLTARRFRVPPALMRRFLPPEQHSFPRFNVLGKLRTPGARKTLHFNAHYDVVPVSGAWRHGDPFSGKVERGWIYGRGTSDMKGSMASLLLALRALRATGTRPAMNVEVSFTADEETDSELGAGWLVRHAPIKPDYAIVMEGGEGGHIGCGHNGVVWLEVTVQGRAAHGSQPEDGINAFEKMSALVLALESYKRTLARRTFVTPEGRMMRATINVGGVFSAGPGGKINTVPAEARFSIDRRVLATEDHAKAERELRAFLAAAARKIPQCRISIAKVSENFACFTSPRHPFFAAMAHSVGRVRQEEPSFHVSTGFNDMHFFVHHLKIPTIGYGPGGKNYHAVDERASVRDLLNTAKIYADLLTNFAG
ncbi:M20 family metallopeptidase [Opitutus terrae]|uniref:Probable succinyl-diaminopimelate desuccinylase n=1 Tax=Opitutus terrae (strain DSM 11246 / JCM 15787 / PB90-1) TaxID=452637 RepID=B1ZVN8_OPITP|nr:ArgE/DapE family deacylase [Opitutus terrae]ACB74135.1 acetylornithine deacetylase or succinyl-diaminopimelate desuccinylase [Opitutus terrae PB90-1]